MRSFVVDVQPVTAGRDGERDAATMVSVSDNGYARTGILSVRQAEQKEEEDEYIIIQPICNRRFVGGNDEVVASSALVAADRSGNERMMMQIMKMI